jgi:hypothetical protein
VPTALDPMGLTEKSQIVNLCQGSRARLRLTARSFVVEVSPGELLKNSPRNGPSRQV